MIPPPVLVGRGQGVELNPANLSFHPIEAPGKNTSRRWPNSLAGTSPYKLWSFTTDSTIRCVNCHGDYRKFDTTTPPAAGSDLAPHANAYRGNLMQNYRDRELKPYTEPYQSGDFALCFMPCGGTVHRWKWLPMGRHELPIPRPAPDRDPEPRKPRRRYRHRRGRTRECGLRRLPLPHPLDGLRRRLPDEPAAVRHRCRTRELRTDRDGQRRLRGMGPNRHEDRLLHPHLSRLQSRGRVVLSAD
jgi:hypothetical protein